MTKREKEERMSAEDRRNMYLDLLSLRRRIGELASERDRVEHELELAQETEKRVVKEVRGVMENVDKTVEVVLLQFADMSPAKAIVVRRLEYGVGIEEAGQPL